MRGNEMPREATHLGIPQPPPRAVCTCETFGNGVVSGIVDPPAPPGALLDPDCPKHGSPSTGRAYIMYRGGQVLWWDVALTTATSRGFNARDLIELGARAAWFRKGWMQ